MNQFVKIGNNDEFLLLPDQNHYYWSKRSRQHDVVVPQNVLEEEDRVKNWTDKASD